MKSTIVAGVLLALFHSQAPAPSALRIVVLEGEDAVNIVNLVHDEPVSGGPANLAFSMQSSSTSGTPSGGSVTSTISFAFSGRLEGDAITGTLTYTLATRGNNLGNDIVGNGTIAMPVTLR